MSRNKALLWVIGPTLLVVALWTGWWFHASREAMGFFQNWVTEQRDSGIDTQFARVTSSGYPFSITLTVDRFGMAGPARGWFVSAEKLDVSFRPWRLDRYDYRTQAPVRIGFVGIPGSLRAPIVIKTLSGRYSVGGATAPNTLLLDAQDLSGPDDMAAKTLSLVLNTPDTPPDASSAAALEGRLAVTDARIAPFIPDRLTGQVDTASLGLTITGPVPPSGSALKRLASWRDGGGIADISDIVLNWGDLAVTGDGTVTLDAVMRPLASFALNVSGLKETAREFEGAGLIDASTRRGIELGAGLLSFASGGGDVVPLPVTIQSGVLSLGPVGVAEVPSLIPGQSPTRTSLPKAGTPPPDDFAPPPPPPTVSEETLRTGNPPAIDN